ncbi:STAS domain-containing protein [Mycolicibacterium komossense]|uniref:Anti-sigma factor antagonist n=1 Tax=Mycolicibacterium komossense TaxID=1779 RepID=A0ABT3CLV4_9MYCO|nr:STAS domain-containing protein [Mycolicibacterium komossense]MCV7230475.1 STAS domain-containing protein [Mycolicibacterium komossense]
MAHHCTNTDSVIAVPGCTVTQSWSGRTAVLTVSGTLDMLTADTLQDAVGAALRTGPLGLIIDLTAVTFLASAGMSVLIATHDVTEPDIPFAVVAHGFVTARPLALTGLTAVIAVHPTLGAALSAE